MRLTDALEPPTSYKIQSSCPVAGNGQKGAYTGIKGRTLTPGDGEVVLLDADSPKPCFDDVLI